MFIGRDSGVTLRDHLQAESYHAPLHDRILAVTASRSDSNWYRSRLQMLVACLSVVRCVIPDECKKFSLAELTDLETLRTLNDRTNRPSDWESARSQPDATPYNDLETSNNTATFEAILICWGVYFSDLRKDYPDYPDYPTIYSIKERSGDSALWQYYKRNDEHIKREYSQQGGSEVEGLAQYDNYPQQFLMNL